MLHQDGTKIVPFYLPVAAVSGGNFTAVGNANGEIDCKGFDRCELIFQFGAIGANTTVAKVQETDVSGSGYTDVTGPNNLSGVATGAIFGTSALQFEDGGAASVLPHTTDANGTFVIDIDTRARKRYLKPLVTAGAGNTFLTGIAILSRPAILPEKAADRNVNAVLRV